MTGLTVLNADEELLDDVRGLGAQHRPDDAAMARGIELAAVRKLDLRGDRDRDPGAPNPWRSV
ncbi:MAG: hypothetical protein ACRDTG_21070 [Pseudonocardiaceae bacterium]